MASEELSTSEAAALCGVTSRQINNYIESGLLSADKKRGSRKWIIQKSEFYRVFPHLHERNQKNSSEESSFQLLQTKMEHLERLLAEKDRRLEEKQESIDFLKKQLEILQQTISTNQKLLEHQMQSKRKFLSIFKRG